MASLSGVGVNDGTPLRSVAKPGPPVPAAGSLSFGIGRFAAAAPRGDSLACRLVTHPARILNR